MDQNVAEEMALYKIIKGLQLEITHLKERNKMLSSEIIDTRNIFVSMLQKYKAQNEYEFTQIRNKLRNKYW
jgi:FtsZ-binding cell division protein ZapB